MLTPKYFPFVQSNRWYTANGRKKRISSDLKKFQPFIEEYKTTANVIHLTKHVRETYNLGLADAVNLLVYLIGVYNNATKVHIFSIEHYLLGKKVAATIS